MKDKSLLEIPTELKDVVTSFEKQGVTVCLAKLTSGSCYGGLLSHQARILYHVKDDYALWTASGKVKDGKFEMGISRQHPVTKEQAAKLMEDSHSHYH